jgi:hypothetical protein
MIPVNDKEAKKDKPNDDKPNDKLLLTTKKDPLTKSGALLFATHSKLTFFSNLN